MRRLATIRQIDSISPIVGADRIEVAHVDGWEVVISKSDNFKVGDLIVYVEIDSKMPETPEYEFLASRKYVVKTIKLRGQISQGLVLPLSVLPPNKQYKLGDDVTDILGITKYDPEYEAELKNVVENKKHNRIVKYLMRYEWFRKLYMKRNYVDTSFPSFIKKTDEERVQNIPNLYKKLHDEKIPLSGTEKIDGTSATYFLRRINKRKLDFGVCSRNRRVAENDSHYWKVANIYGIKHVLNDLIKDDEYIILQGEITGAGIQGGKYGSELQFHAFNLIRPNKKYSTSEMAVILKDYGIKTVPIVVKDYIVPETIAEIVDYANDMSVVANMSREGVVFRNVEENISFKVINPQFLLKNDA